MNTINNRTLGNRYTTTLQSHLSRALLCAALGLGGVLSSGLHAQLWQANDDYQGVTGLTSRALAIATDSTKTLLYTAGWTTLDSSGDQAGVVRASSDFGQSWTTLDTWSPPNGWPIAVYQAFCSAAPSSALPNGGLFAAGDICTDASNTATIDWIVRRSIDAGSTWTLQDVVDSGAGGKAQCRAIAVAPGGAIYAAGLTGTNQGAGGWVWLVRKSSDGGESWTTVDSVWGSSTREARAVGFTPSGSIFVAGAVANVWTVRRSMDSGANWTAVDSYKLNGGFSEAYGIAVDAAGNVYVTGKAQAYQKGAYKDQWVVRRSANGGSFWSTVDNVTLESYRNFAAPVGWPTGITAVPSSTLFPSGALFVCGFGAGSDGSTHWLVRQGIPGSKGTISWTTSEDYQPPSGNSARANAITTDAYGNIYAAGRASDGIADHWTCRRFEN